MTGEIPAADPRIGEDEKRAVEEVLDSGQIAAGPKVEDFEDEFSGYVGTEEGVAVSSGTSALITALLAAGVGEEDKVIVPSYSFIATATSVLLTGAEPIFVDIDPETYCIDTKKIEKTLTLDTEAIIPVHLYGHPAEMDEINRIAEENELTVIEDACQSHGAEYRGKKTGDLGDIGCFSFYATKNMVTGEGGMLTTDDEEIAERAKAIREHGRTDGGYDVLGYNFLMTDVEAAIGIKQLEKLDDMNEQRKKNAEILNSELSSLTVDAVVPPTEREEVEHVYHQYALRIRENRDRVVRGMQKAGIQVRKGYDKPLYREKCIDEDVVCGNAEDATDEVIWIPIHSSLDAADMRRVAYGLKQFL